MSSFYGNGGYSSGGGGGSGEVISVNGKKGRVTLDAADVHALPEDTLIPSLDGFATEEWVNESIKDFSKNDSLWIGGAWIDKNTLNPTIQKLKVPFGSFVGEFPGEIYYEGNFQDFTNKFMEIFNRTGQNLNILGVILTIDDIIFPDYLNFQLDGQSGDIVIPITNLTSPNNNIRIHASRDNQGNPLFDNQGNLLFESILESKVVDYFNGNSISKVTLVILDSLTNSQSNTNTFPIEITPSIELKDLSGGEVITSTYPQANHTVNEVTTAINQGLFTYAYIKNDNQNQLYYLISSSIEGPVFAYIDYQANNISTIRFMNQYSEDNRVIIETNIPIIHSHQDISGKADKTEIIPKPATAGTEGQVLTIDANGNPKWDNTSFVKVTDDGQGNVSMETLYGVLVDAVPTQNSNNLVTSGGVYATQSPTIDFSVNSFTNNTPVTCNMDWTQIYNTTGSQKEKNIILHDTFQSFYCYKAVKTTGLGGVTISFYFLNENLDTQYIVKTTSSGSMTLLVNNLLSNYYTKTEIDTQIGNIETLLAQI